MKMCLCGRMAVKKSMGGWACERCTRIEKNHFGGGRSKQYCGRRRSYGGADVAFSGSADATAER